MTTQSKTYKILIVEDEDMLRSVYSNIFRIEKFQVDTAENGQVALQKIIHAPDIIILDILMPIMDGLAFLENARVSEKIPSTKILVLSNLSDPDTVAKAKRLGATRHLIKSSLSPSQLVANVRELLDSPPAKSLLS